MIPILRLPECTASIPGYHNVTRYEKTVVYNFICGHCDMYFQIFWDASNRLPHNPLIYATDSKGMRWRCFT